MRKITNRGFSVIEIGIAIVVIGLIGGIGYKVVTGKKDGGDMTAAEIKADEAKRHASGNTANNSNNDAPVDLDVNAKFITAAPIDFAQVASFSKYRSCSGHDFSGVGIDGVSEKLRSMKHYIFASPKLTGANDKVNVYAPFAGTITVVEPIKDFGRGISLSPDSSKGWRVAFGHVDTLDSIVVGAHVKAGDLLGTAAIGPHGRDTEIIVNNPGQKTGATMDGLDSFMHHLSPALEKSFAEHGLTIENSIVSKAARDADPCPLLGQQNYGDEMFAGDRSEDKVTVR